MVDSKLYNLLARNGKKFHITAKNLVDAIEQAEKYLKPPDGICRVTQIGAMPLELFWESKNNITIVNGEVTQ